MEPSTLAPAPAKPARWWIAVTLVAGAVGALGAIAAGGSGTYDIAPFRVELKATPAALGKTELAIRGIEQLAPSHAEAGTHNAPIVFRATLIELTGPATPDDLAVATSPTFLADKMRDDGKGAMTRFGVKLALLALAGGAAGGLAISFGRWRRVIGGALGGLLVFAIIGVLVQQTYDASEFAQTQYRVEGQRAPGGLPSP